MKKTRSLQVASFILLLGELASTNLAGQTPWFKTLAGQLKTDEAASDFGPSGSAVTYESKSAPALPRAPEPTALSSRDPQKFGVIDRAYLDAFTILNDDNPCSRFFGGRPAIAALSELVQGLKPKYLDRHVAIRMSGATIIYQSNLTGFSYRIFEKAEVNLSSSFFRSNSAFERRSYVTSSFAPNTRETRVVVLLHELGHLVKAPDKQWVLSDDGNDGALSVENTERVVTTCRQQIEGLSRLTAEQELEMTRVQP